MTTALATIPALPAAAKREPAMTYRTIPAFAILDADTNLDASLLLPPDVDADTTDPRVFIHDRHYGVSIGLNLSDLRRLMAAVDKAADLNTDAPALKAAA